MQVLVRNLNTMDYKETYEDEVYEIPAGGTIQMDKLKAVQFLGQFTPPVLNGQGVPDPRYLKKLVIEPLPEPKQVEDEPQKFICQMDGKEFKTQAALNRHIKANWADEIIDEDARKKIKGEK